MRLLVTGGAGYIGSHTALELLQAGHDVVIVDNLSNSHPAAVERIGELAGRSPTFYPIDLLDEIGLAAVFAAEPFDGVIHFAALKSVAESVAQPLRYYRNNVIGTFNLVALMDRHDVRRLVFSSSATVYGDPQRVPIPETAPLSAVNPYGQSKVIVEQLLRDVQASDPRWDVALLRYFNPVGAHASGRIGEDPQGVPNNLVPYVAQVAIGRLPTLRIFGDSYATPDGTGVRDYIHVVDLAVGHLRALEKLAGHPGLVTYNLGTGRGHSVLDVVQAFERITGRTIPFEISSPRPGDVAACYADSSLATRELGWRAERTLEDMIRDSWRWQSQNPNGYAG